MLPFGRLNQIRGTRRQVSSAWMAALEKAGCEVTRESDSQLSVLVPGWETQLLGEEAALSLSRWFWDRMIVTVSEEGRATFRLAYFSSAQILWHGLIAALFALQAPIRAAQDPSRFALLFLGAQCIPLVAACAGFYRAREAAIRRAFE